jgi:hypothetical protein
MSEDIQHNPASVCREPPAPATDDIRNIVERKLNDLHIHTVVLVDDDFAPSLPPERWTELVDVARTHNSALLSEIDQIVADVGTGNVEDYPNAIALFRILRAVAASACQEAKDLLAAPNVQDSLVKLETYLLELKREVKKYWKIDDAPRDEKLYFLDYRMQQDPDTQGLDASLLLKGIISELTEQGDPPAAILMSRVRDDRPTVEDLEDITRNGGGFVRSNFRYLDKTETLPSRTRFLFLMNDLLDSLPLGRDYFSRVRSLRQAAQATVAKVAAETCALLPADFQIFANAIGGSGDVQRAAMADHLISLFTGLLAAELRNDGETYESLGKFFDMLMAKPGMAPGDVGSHTLHRLHARLLYDCSDWVKSSPVGFGDIYRQRGDAENYYIVITPECDLEPRYKHGVCIGPKAPFIVLLRGELRDERPPDRDRDTEIVTPLIVDPDTESVRWIYWQLREPSMVPAKRLSLESKRFIKWGRLRVQEAEKIQMRYATDLLAVGTDDLSDRVEKREAMLWQLDVSKPHEQRALQKFHVMEIANPKKRDEIFWALAAGCEHILCADKDPIISASTIADLRSYQPKSEFIQKLRSFNIRVAEGDAPPPAKKPTEPKGLESKSTQTLASEESVKKISGTTEIAQASQSALVQEGTSFGQSSSAALAPTTPVATAKSDPMPAKPSAPPDGKGSVPSPMTRPVINFGWFASKNAPAKWAGPIPQDLSLPEPPERESESKQINQHVRPKE